MAPILDPIERALKDMKESQKAAKGLLKEVDDPLDALEEKVRSAMKLYKLEELKQIQSKTEEHQQLQEDINEAADGEAFGRTTTIRQKATATREFLEEKQARVFDSTPTPAQAEGSTTRVQKKVRVVDVPRFLRFVADNYEELKDCAEPIQTTLNRWLK